MVSNKRILMFFTLVAMAIIKLVIGMETAEHEERNECLKSLQYFCGDKKRPNIDDCGEFSILRYHVFIQDVPDPVYTYFRHIIFPKTIAPGLQMTDVFCSNRATNQFLSNDYDKETLFEDSDEEAENPLEEAENLFFDDEGEDDDSELDNEEDRKGTSLGAEEKVKLDNKEISNYDEGTSFKAEEEVDEEFETEIKLKLKSKCLNKLSRFRKDNRRKIIKYAMFYVNLDTYENPDAPDYKKNETARDYLIHISKMVQVFNLKAPNPDKFCASIGKPQSKHLLHEMYPLKKRR